MRTENGRVYTPETVTEWMTGAGITGCRLELIPGGPGAVGAIIGSSKAAV
jgi:hypothetical protein